jgi:hypothetical protein
MHAADELYIDLWGTARELTILGTAFSDPENSGTDVQEPTLMAIRYGTCSRCNAELNGSRPAASPFRFYPTSRPPPRFA